MPGIRLLSKQAYISKRWQVLWYKNAGTIGIRRKFGDKAQTISFGGKHCLATEATMRSHGDDCLRKLDNGEKEAEVEKWAKEMVAKPEDVD